MSMHKKPLLPHEETALVSHGLPVGQPSQLADAFRMGMEAERERWRQVAKAVIESHDAALAYVYERLRSQGVGSITIPDSAVAEIRAVNALRELVQPNTSIQRAGTGPLE